MEREPQSENQRKQKERQVLRPYKRTKNAIKCKSDGDTNCNWCTQNNFQSLIRELEELELEKQAEIIQTIRFLKSARILRRVLEICYHSDSSERQSVNTGVKKL